MQSLIDKLFALKKEKNALILAHFYAPAEVQALADFVGDSYLLSKKAAESSANVIVFAGVRFMGESAKALSPDKIVLMPDLSADCPMAHMATKEKIDLVRNTYEDVAVVCYINSTVELKSMVDVCVTSANAVKVVRGLKEKNIFFIPDQNLAHYVAEQIPEKNFIFNDGFCPIHHQITSDDILTAKALHPDCQVLTHPECSQDVLSLSDYIGSTSGIINYAKSHPADAYIICTEKGVLYELKRQCPNTSFYPVKEDFICPDMKLNTIERLIECLENSTNEIVLDQDIIQKACQPLEKMLELAK